MEDEGRPPRSNVVPFPTRMAVGRATSRIAYRHKCEAERGGDFDHLAPETRVVLLDAVRATRAGEPNPWHKALELYLAEHPELEV